MRFSCYEWSPQRFHPEFNGIASRYSDYKKQRLTQQKRRKQLQSDHSYTLNLNESLDKSLQFKVQQLYKLQQAKQRHNEDLRFKEQLNQQRRMQLESLRERNNRYRLQNKKNREEARKNIIEKNQHSRIRLKQNMINLHQRLSKEMGQKSKEKSLKCKLVKEEHDEGSSKVNQYFREKNKESLNFYLWKINEERKKQRNEQKQIKRYQKNISKMNQTVQSKKVYLDEVQKQIYKLKTNIKSVSSCGVRPKRKKVKMTEGSEDEHSVDDWKKKIKNIINPEDRLEHF